MTKLVHVREDDRENGSSGGYYLVDDLGVKRAHIRSDFYKGNWWGDLCAENGGYIHTGKPSWKEKKTRREVVILVCDHLDLNLPPRPRRKRRIR